MLFLPTCQNKQLSYIQIITNQKIIISELFKLSETSSKANHTLMAKSSKIWGQI